MAQGEKSNDTTANAPFSHKKHKNYSSEIRSAAAVAQGEKSNDTTANAPSK